MKIPGYVRAVIGRVPDSDGVINPQVGVVFKLTGDTTLHASVGKKTRFPHMQELYGVMSGGNPDLQKQKTMAYEIGAKHYFTKSLKGWFSYFYNDVEDLIERIYPAGGKDWRYENVGEARIQGIEGGLDYQVSDNFWAGANYTYLSTKDKETDHELEGRPRHKLNFDLRYLFSFGLTANLQTSYTHREFAYDRGESRKYPDFFLVNAKLIQKLGNYFGIDSEAFVSVSNLTDKNYDEGDPMPGRNFLTGLTFRR